jgi:hypothetical protein
MIEKFRINFRDNRLAEQMSPRYIVAEELRKLGYTRLSGRLVAQEKDLCTLDTLCAYEVSTRDILFKRFDIGYVPPWKKQREILFRRFSL